MVQILQDFYFDNKATGENDNYCVTFEAKITKEDDGIGSYEYWGMRGYDSSPYLCVDDNFGIMIESVETYTPEQLEIINAYIDENFSELEKRLVKEFKKENPYNHINF